MHLGFPKYLSYTLSFSSLLSTIMNANMDVDMDMDIDIDVDVNVEVDPEIAALEAEANRIVRSHGNPHPLSLPFSLYSSSPALFLQ